MSSINLCLCGCQQPVKSKWKPGHNQRGSGCNFWKGGDKFTKNGYKRVPSQTGLDQEYEHRKVMKEILGRDLMDDEEVHHINGNKTDNRPENLIVLSKAEHRRLEHVDPNIHLRTCVLCDGPTSQRRDGGFRWYKFEDGYICHRCYRRNHQ